MTRSTKRQRGWAKNSLGNPSGAKLNLDPLEDRRRELWDRALAEGIPVSVAARMIAAILRAEVAATEGTADAA